MGGSQKIGFFTNPGSTDLFWSMGRKIATALRADLSPLAKSPRLKDSHVSSSGGVAVALRSDRVGASRICHNAGARRKRPPHPDQAAFSVVDGPETSATRDTSAIGSMLGIAQGLVLRAGSAEGSGAVRLRQGTPRRRTHRVLLPFLFSLIAAPFLLSDAFVLHPTPSKNSPGAGSTSFGGETLMIQRNVAALRAVPPPSRVRPLRALGGAPLPPLMGGARLDDGSTDGAAPSVDPHPAECFVVLGNLQSGANIGRVIRSASIFGVTGPLSHLKPGL